MPKRPSKSPEPAIRLRGACQHNLKRLDLDIPLNRLIVVSGVSGSGKSSLAFDTLYAEGQRRYVETFSPYARQFMDRMDRPAVDAIEGIPPAVAIDRKDPVRTSRSTVGTMTEITDYVKLLFARLAVLHCPGCGRPVASDTPQAVWAYLHRLPAETPVVISFPWPVDPASEKVERSALRRMGYDRVWHGDRVCDLDEVPAADGLRQLAVVADRFRISNQKRRRAIDSAEQAFRFGAGNLSLHVGLSGKETRRFSSRLACAQCGVTFPRPVTGLFSFNSPAGACPNCRGFGRVIDIDLDLIIPDRGLSLNQGAVKPWGSRLDDKPEFDDLAAFCRRRRIPMNRPFGDLKPRWQQAIVDGTEGYYGVRGFFKWLESRTYRMHVRVFLSRYRSYDRCPACNGSRFRPEALAYRLGGSTIAAIYAMNVDRAAAFFDRLPIPPADEAARLVADEIRSRLSVLQQVGLGFLTLDRQSRTLSGGEVQRVALTSALGANLVNALYVLDEPSIGLHPRDSHRLVQILRRLRSRPNTVMVVEHDPEIIRHSDWLLDMGPGAGEQGGQVMYFGPTTAADSLTADYVTGRRAIPVPARRRAPDAGHLVVRGAAEHNLQGIDVAFPLAMVICLTGVSGSGKTTLAETILFRAVKRAKGSLEERPGRHAAVDGLERLTDAVMVDQHPVGRTPRANLLTYTGAMTALRQRMADTPQARRRGLKPGFFSFNVTGGRCEACRGEGFEKIEMQFLSDVYITCPECNGRRFGPDVLDIRWRGRNLPQILSMTVAQALEWFADQPRIEKALAPLSRVGLGYMRLGQPLNTLSGGEAQRLKLSRHLQQRRGGATLFVFDEPTTGLHFEDIAKLLPVFHDLADRGHTVLIIEHNLEVVKSADWVIDLGPEGGEAGGRIVTAGTPEAVAACSRSHTGRYLKAAIDPSSDLPAAKASAPASGLSRSEPAVIDVQGAREHNLQNVNLSIPRNAFVALTGVSGSGKSSLAFDILFAEGQRRYLESLAPYVRQYVKVLERPDVDRVAGLPPAVAIEQRASHAGRRSTVATLTEIYHFLRLLFSKAGIPHCPGCRRPLAAMSRDRLMDGIQRRFADRNLLVLAPKIAGRKGYHKTVLARALKDGFTEARIDGRLTDIAPGMALSRYHTHTIELVAGRLPHPDARRIVDTALAQGDGGLVVVTRDGGEAVFSLQGVCPECGIGLKPLEPRLFSFNSLGACPRCRGLGIILSPASGRGRNDRQPSSVCPECGGSRLNPEARSVRVDGVSLPELTSLSAGRAAERLAGLDFGRRRQPVAAPILSELATRLALLRQLGLAYLSLDRGGDTLSGGEAQRLRLAAQLGSNLTGVVYILDEPTIGLHPRDNRMLIDALRALQRRGNTILVVEHDEATIREADHVIDLGPGAGRYGGRVVAAGPPGELHRSSDSITGRWLNAPPPEDLPAAPVDYRRLPRLTLSGAAVNNLKSISVRLPLNTLIAVTGVSGSGKSSLLKGTLLRAVRRLLAGDPLPDDLKGLAVDGWRGIDRILEVNHQPIGRTPRSVPASYVGFLGRIRALFAQVPEARARGYSPGRFSFNVAGGRCEACKGQGRPRVEMSFLPDVTIPCDICAGRRYNDDTLSIRYRGHSIAEVLEMTFNQAADLFQAVPSIRNPVEFVRSIGLGYLQLGQPSPTLSGGEAQRIKLAAQLSRPSAGKTLYVLDEPTTGLHPADVRRLMAALRALVASGHTVTVIEHNLDVIRSADYVIDMGPEGGEHGGRVVAAGSPDEMLQHTQSSHTARWLSDHLKKAQAASPRD